MKKTFTLFSLLILFFFKGVLGQANSIPTVSTDLITLINGFNAVGGGNISNEGGSNVLSRGLVWDINSNPTIALATKTKDGTGIGGFNSSISGLSINTKYYIRAYATNSLGTAYGNEITFITLPYNVIEISDETLTSVYYHQTSFQYPTKLIFKNLTTVNDYVYFHQTNNLIEVEFPKLKTVGGYFYFHQNLLLKKISSPNLSSVVSYLYVYGNLALDTLEVCNLKNIFCNQNDKAYFAISNNTALVDAKQPCFSATICGNITTPAPTGESTQTFNSQVTIANIVVTGSAVKWYNLATGGLVLAATTPLVNGSTYYASQTINGVESKTRFAVNIILTSPNPTWVKESIPFLNQTFSQSSYNDSTSVLYSLNQGGTVLNYFNVATSTSNYYSISNPISEIGLLIVDKKTGKLFGLSYYGKDAIYEFDFNNKQWAKITNGAKDWETFGAADYFNGVDNKVGLFGGYGFYAVKNWLYEVKPELNKSWELVSPNQNNSTINGIAKAVKTITFNKDRTKLYLFGGQGNYSGSQTEKTCTSSISPWASDVGVYCWLRDLWEYDFTLKKFINIIPSTSTKIPLQGAIALNYNDNNMYLMGGFTPPAIYNSQFYNTTNYNNQLYSYKLGSNGAFIPENVVTTALPNTTLTGIGTNYLYFDGKLNKLIWANQTGLYTLALSNSLVIPSAPTGNTSQTLCSGATVASLTAIGTAIKWYAASTGGTALANTTTLVNGTTYYASQTLNGVESTDRLAVTVSIPKISTIASLTNVALGSNASLTGSISGSATFQWQSNINDIGWINLPNNTTYAGSNTNKLTVKNIKVSNHMQEFRLIATAGNCIDTSNVATTSVIYTLPVELTSFNATLTQNQVNLNWETASELNNNYFTINKSRDGKSFTPLITVPSKGDGGIYLAVDQNPFSGTTYYQLSQTDKDGKTKELGIKAVTFSFSNTQKVVIYPNPTQNEVKVSFEKDYYTTAKLVDLQGRTLQKRNISIADIELTFDLKSLDAGNYLIQLEGKGLNVQKVVKD